MELVLIVEDDTGLNRGLCKTLTIQIICTILKMSVWYCFDLKGEFL